MACVVCLGCIVGRYGVQWQVCVACRSSSELLHWAHCVGRAWYQWTACLLPANPPRYGILGSTLWPVVLIYTSIHFSGTKVIPCDFIAPVETQNPLAGGLHHEVSGWMWLSLWVDMLLQRSMILFGLGMYLCCFKNLPLQRPVHTGHSKLRVGCGCISPLCMHARANSLPWEVAIITWPSECVSVVCYVVW